MKIGLPPSAEMTGAKPADATSHAAAGASGAATAAAPGIAHAGHGGSRRADHVTLSTAASSISQMATSDDFDQGKVMAIQAAMREGRFAVNAEAIADRLISEAAALISPRTH